MHACLNVDEIVRLIACELVASGAEATAVALARCHKGFEDPVLDTLWETQDQLLPLLRSLPRDVWNEDECTVSTSTTSVFTPLNCLVRKSFRRFPTPPEWARFRKYARRMRGLCGLDDLSSEVFSVLQHYVSKEPLFQNLKTLELWSTTEELVPFIPLFLSSATIAFAFSFDESPDLFPAMVVSMITTLPTLCPNLQEINLDSLPQHPTTTAAVSGMLLASNRNTLRSLHIDSPLTEEALEVVCKLPNLRELSVIVERDTALPMLVLPNLTDLSITYEDDSDWFGQFRGGTFGKLETVSFHSESEQIGDLLEGFERVALATSIHNTLLQLFLYMACSWNPNYSSLLPFTQLVHLVVHFPCDGDDCSSTVDDDVTTALAQAMPKLRHLALGDMPCNVPTGITVKGLAVLAHHCPDLSTLRVHFQVDSLVTPPETDAVPSDARYAPLQRGCDLVELEVGDIFVEQEEVATVAMTLALIFPRLESIAGGDTNWENVMDAICDSRKIDNYSSK